MVNHLIVDFSGKNLANKRFIVNVVKRIAGIRGINELNIGHSIISRAVFVGLYNAVREMRLLTR